MTIFVMINLLLLQGSKLMQMFVKDLGTPKQVTSPIVMLLPVLYVTIRRYQGMEACDNALLRLILIPCNQLLVTR